MSTPSRVGAGVQMSTYLLAYLGTGTFRYLPYIYLSADGEIIVREYSQPLATLPKVATGGDAILF